MPDVTTPTYMGTETSSKMSVTIFIQSQPLHTWGLKHALRYCGVCLSLVTTLTCPYQSHKRKKTSTLR